MLKIVIRSTNQKLALGKHDYLQELDANEVKR